MKYITNKTREKIWGNICGQGVEKVYQELQRVDPEYATKISKTDSIRIVRALAVYLDTGKRFSEFHQNRRNLIRIFGISSEYSESHRNLWNLI